MKKVATGFMAMAFALGLAACQDNNETVGEAENPQDLEQLESPAAGEPATPPMEEENRSMEPGMGADPGTTEPGTQSIEPDVQVIPPEEEGTTQQY